MLMLDIPLKQFNLCLIVNLLRVIELLCLQVVTSLSHKIDLLEFELTLIPLIMHPAEISFIIYRLIVISIISMLSVHIRHNLPIVITYILACVFLSV
jgi:hypothetical protein